MNIYLIINLIYIFNSILLNINKYKTLDKNKNNIIYYIPINSDIKLYNQL